LEEDRRIGLLLLDLFIYSDILLDEFLDFQIVDPTPVAGLSAQLSVVF
jgi:hypothetical protein